MPLMGKLVIISIRPCKLIKEPGAFTFRNSQCAQRDALFFIPHIGIVVANLLVAMTNFYRDEAELRSIKACGQWLIDTISPYIHIQHQLFIMWPSSVCHFLQYVLPCT